MAPVPIKVKKAMVNVEVDEHPRPQTTLDGLKKLPTLFKENGLVTAGSASVIKHLPNKIIFSYKKMFLGYLRWSRCHRFS